MKVAILAGGFGTRLSEETSLVPKPMVEIGGRPILWHIMKIYSYWGYNEFVILTGYKSHVINEDSAMNVSCKHCYQSSFANWNRKSSFYQMGLDFSPEWEGDEKSYV